LTCSASQKISPNSEVKNYNEYLELWTNIINPFKLGRSKITLPLDGRTEFLRWQEK